MTDKANKKGKPSRGPAFRLSAAWIIFVVLCAVVAPLTPMSDFESMDWENQAAPPGTLMRASTNGSGNGRVHILGTDAMGRDLAARLIFGARMSLIAGLGAPLIGLIVGGLLGVLAGYYRGRLESFIIGVMDVVLAFPGIVLLLAVSFYLGPGLGSMIIALGLLTIPAFARVARANTLACARQEYVLAARLIGHGDLEILTREILPNILMPLLVYALLAVSHIIAIEGALSFLGLGAPPPAPSWGGTIAEGREVLGKAPHVCLFPALAMYLTVLSFNLLGDSLGRGLDSREEKI